jgi:hypothetical protein
MSSIGGTASDDGSGGSAVVGGPADLGAVAEGPVPQESTNPVTGRLRVAAQRFVVQLRRSEGFDSGALDELCEAIDSCGRAWARSPTVPKAAALILAELFPAIDGCACLYPDPMRQRIIEAATRVARSVSASLDTPDGGLDPDL